MHVTFLTYNILDGGRGREKELFEIIAAQNADVILLQEIIGRNFVEELAARLGADFFIAESNSRRTIALLTRFSIHNAASFHPRLLRHTCLEAVLECAPQRNITIFGVHLAAPAYTLFVELYRLREANVILKHIAAAHAERIVLAGDFNSIAPNDAVDLSGLPWHLRASVILQGGLLARQVIGKIHAQHFIDCFRALHSRENGFTLPPNPPRVRLDYFFVNDILRHSLRACNVVTLPDAIRNASDHLPVRMELEL